MHSSNTSFVHRALSTGFVCALLLMVLGHTTRSSAQDAPSAPSTPHEHQSTAATLERSEVVWRTVAGLRLLELNIGHADAARPLVVFIHGRGDMAHTSWIDGLHAPGRYVFPQAKARHSNGFSWFPYNGLGPAAAQLATDVSACAAELAALIAALRAEQPASGKAIVSGFSQGGVLSYALALLHPDQVALAVPIAGLLPEQLFAKLPKPGVRYPPIHALHGTEDNIVPFSVTSHMTNTLRARGLDITLQRFAGLGHEVPEEVRARMQKEVRRGIEAQAAVQARAAKTPRRPTGRAAVGGKAK